MNKYLFFAIIYLGATITVCFGQSQTVQPSSKTVLTAEDTASYKKQAAQLVSFMEFAFNTLGSKKSEYKEKDIIINQSYVKFFKDAKVQIEDDLLENRDVVTNKDVQAYLKDIDFFFTDVAFKFTIEEITQELNEKGEIFFKVKTSRNLKGVSIEGKQINNNKPRFIEINLDDAKRELKIVSIYTTRTGEEQEIISWWNDLDRGWRNYFSANTVVADSIPLKNIVGLGQDFLMISSDKQAEAGIPSVADTIRVMANTATVFSEIRRIIRSEQIDITGAKGIFSLEPLSVFTSLKHLTITGATVTGLEPIRNLSKLETLKASNSKIASLAPLQYSSSLRNLDISSTFITDLSPIINFNQLEIIDISGIQTDNLAALSDLVNIRQLRMNQSAVRSLDGIENLQAIEIFELSGTSITDLTPVGKLGNLKRLSFDKTYISDLKPLAGLKLLEYVYFDNTSVSDISPLENIASLKAVYCDKTMIKQAQAMAFHQKRPDVKVIYESEELTAWWNMLPEHWKLVFKAMVKLDNVPDKEQLHELTNLKKLDISGNSLIKDLSPLRKLQSLELLNASKTGINEVMPVRDLMNLQTLIISNCGILDLSPVSGLNNLQVLDISSTKISDLTAIAGLRNLRRVSLNNCALADISPIYKLKRLELIYAEGVSAISGAISQLWDSIPEVLVIYQTQKLNDWWNGLNDAWKNAFNKFEPLGGTLTTEYLHGIASLKELDLSESKNISDLQPLRMLVRLEKLNISRLAVSDLLPLVSSSRLKDFNCSNTPVTDISPLTGHRKMISLNISNTQINNIDVIEGFADLKILDISGTQVARLNPVALCTKLEQLDCYNTRISNIKPLDDLQSLNLLRIYNTRVSEKNIGKLKAANPKLEVVYY